MINISDFGNIHISGSVVVRSSLRWNSLTAGWTEQRGQQRSNGVCNVNGPKVSKFLDE